jgi:hypothetical protein
MNQKDALFQANKKIFERVEAILSETEQAILEPNMKIYRIEYE